MNAVLQRWRHLPRDSRDVLFLLAVIAWTLLPNLPSLPIWCIFLIGLVLSWRIGLAWRQRPLPPRWLLIVLLLAALLAMGISYQRAFGRDAAVTLLVVLTALKTLELRVRRDALVIFFLGFFLILTHFFQSQSLMMALMMISSVWGLLTGWVLSHMPVGQPALTQAARLAGKTALLGMPMMIGLFILFPRLDPLWGQPHLQEGQTGLSDRLTLGDVAQLAQDDSIVMRLRFIGSRTLDPKDLYFRGPVLSQFDGRTWTRIGWENAPDNSAVAADPLWIRTDGEGVDYQLTLEPQKLRFVPLLEVTPAVPRIEGASRPMRLFARSDLEWQSIQPLNDRLRLQARAWPSFQHGPLEITAELTRFLRLPIHANPRTQAWAAKLREDPLYAQADAPTLAQVLLHHIRKGEFLYTLKPGVYGPDAIDEFWLDRKAGFCEHYAASFVFIMRSLGIPARIVTGYQGAEHNPIDDTWIVRQKFAHAWAEYWQEGVGWLRADPTSAVAPERIEQGSTLASDPGFVLRTLDHVSPALWNRVRLLWDATNNRWDQWVLSYSSRTQTDLLRHLGFGDITLSLLLRLMLALMGSLSLSLTLWLLWRRRAQDPWLKHWASIQAVAPASSTPLALAQEIERIHGPAAQRLCQALQAFCEQRYGNSLNTPPSASFLRQRARFIRQELKKFPFAAAPRYPSPATP